MGDRELRALERQAACGDRVAAARALRERLRGGCAGLLTEERLHVAAFAGSEAARVAIREAGGAEALGLLEWARALLKLSEPAAVWASRAAAACALRGAPPMSEFCQAALRAVATALASWDAEDPERNRKLVSVLYRAAPRLPLFRKEGFVSEAVSRAGCVAFLYRPSADRAAMFEVALAAWRKTLADREKYEFLPSALSELKDLFLEEPYAARPTTTLEESFVKGVRTTVRVVGEERARTEIGSALQAWALEESTEDPLAAWSGNSLPSCYEVLDRWPF